MLGPLQMTHDDTAQWVKDALTSSENYSLTVFAISLQRTDELNVVSIGTLRSLTKLTSYDAKIGV